MSRFIATAIAASLALAAASMALAPIIALAQGAAQPLVKFQIKDGGIPASLTGQPGDAEKGRAAMIDQKLGNCLACHEVTALKNQPYPGNVGPSLDGVASRLTAAQIRLRIVDPTKLNPDTMMPPFYRVDGLNRVLHQFQGKPILTAEQVEDVVAFLETLK
jgi:L-cysteine S-thiosulfotransferase